MIFICSPFRGEVEKNVAFAQDVCRVCAKNGILGIAPHLYFPQFLDDGDKHERDFGISQGLVFMALCDEVWVFGNVISEGMHHEIAHAERINKPVKYIKDIEAWKQALAG